MPALGPFEILILLLFVGGASFLIPLMQRRRHVERLQALKNGQPLPEGKAWQALTCIAIGAVLPIFCLGLASNMIMTLRSPGMNSEGIFLFALVLVVIGIVSLISGLALAYRLMDARDRAGSATTNKPPFDPNSLDNVEAYDVASRHD